jgi:cyclopropane-fatty-acyl-phospholipid synthase
MSAFAETDPHSGAEPIDVTAENLRHLPGLPLLARFIFRILLKLKAGSLVAVLPDGRRLRFRGSEPGADAVMQIRDFVIARRIVASGPLGAAEAFLEGMWDSPNITTLLELFVRNKEALQARLTGFPLARLGARLFHAARRNSRNGSKRNIEFHYDLGNAFYRHWLDHTMTYSSARFAHAGQALAEAQLNKYRSLAERIGLKREHHLLEIGSGWGGFG